MRRMTPCKNNKGYKHLGVNFCLLLHEFLFRCFSLLFLKLLPLLTLPSSSLYSTFFLCFYSTFFLSLLYLLPLFLLHLLPLFTLPSSSLYSTFFLSFYSTFFLSLLYLLPLFTPPSSSLYSTFFLSLLYLLPLFTPPSSSLYSTFFLSLLYLLPFTLPFIALGERSWASRIRSTPSHYTPVYLRDKSISLLSWNVFVPYGTEPSFWRCMIKHL